VFDNMAFGLRQRHLPKTEIGRRVNEAARTLGLEETLAKKPRTLSGGQRQRVALGRAIVREPEAFLMDEPLSNLDAKLRTQTRGEIRRLQQEVRTTTVYVTHDQVEAMTMGHRVAVLKDGVLQQCDTPQTLYHEPINVFVAGFIGSPAMNLVEVGEERPLQLGGSTLALAPPGEAALADASGPITVGFRPEALQVGDGPLRAQIRSVEDLGPEVFVHVYLDHQGEMLPLVSKMFPPFDGQPGDSVGLQITGATHLFAADGSRVVSTTASLRGASASPSVTADASPPTS
ncbi:MAG TPA: ABC transporter ATP-binding protein, partial [Solirubrobacteraceae bacterium]